MVISLSVICASVIKLLFADCVSITAAMHVSPLSRGISSESSDDPIQLDAYGCSGSLVSMILMGADAPLSH